MQTYVELSICCEWSHKMLHEVQKSENLTMTVENKELFNKIIM